VVTIYALGGLSLALCALSFISCEANRSDRFPLKTQSYSLRNQQSHRELQRPEHPCVLVQVEADHGTEEEEVTFGYHNRDRDEIRCELIDDDIAKSGGRYHVSIVGLESGSLDGIESGVSTLAADGAVFLDGALRIPADAAIEVGSIDDIVDEAGLRWRRLRSRQKNRKLAVTGSKKVLVVRANAKDHSTTADMATLSNNIFGTAGDTATLVSQYDACSYGQLTIEPYEQNGGVIEVNINSEIEGVNKFRVEDLMTAAAAKVVGGLWQFDNVMLCLPPGTGNWIAYAYVGSWLSVFNDDWCQQLSTQVHEVGHNFGLAHSGKNGDDYGDKSGMMGYSFKSGDTPLQCFNPSKSYKLGWYQNSVVDWDPLTQGTWFGTIEGVADYKENSTTQTIVIRIIRETNRKDLFVGYNRRKGINIGVVEHGDEVVIIEDQDSYDVSNFVAGLHPNSETSMQRRTFYDFESSNRNLVVDFSSYGDSEDEAFVAIYFEDCPYPVCCEGLMCGPTVTGPIRSPATPPAPVSITSTSEKDEASPILVEILPNPSRRKKKYIEIYNPHSVAINLTNYAICIKNGRKGDENCIQLNDFNLDPGAYFMLCRDKEAIVGSRTCHQQKFFRIRKAKKQIVSLRYVANNEDSAVDAIHVPSSIGYERKAFIRTDLSLPSFCGIDCWRWSEPQTASVGEVDGLTAESTIIIDEPFDSVRPSN